MMGEKEKMMLISCDGKEFKVDKGVALELEIVRSSINNNGDSDSDSGGEGIVIPQVSGDILAKVIEYCNKHAQAAIDEKEVNEWDADFIKVDKDTLLGMAIAASANNLNIRGLVELTCQAIADTVKYFTIEEMRIYYNIENDFTADEEAQLRKENDFAIEDDFRAEEEEVQIQIPPNNYRRFKRRKRIYFKKENDFTAEEYDFRAEEEAAQIQIPPNNYRRFKRRKR